MAIQSTARAAIIGQWPSNQLQGRLSLANGHPIHLNESFEPRAQQWRRNTTQLICHRNNKVQTNVFNEEKKDVNNKVVDSG